MTDRTTPRIPPALRTRVSRRRVLRAAGAAGAGLGALALGACDRGSSGPRPTATPTPRRGGVLRTATTLPMTYGLDPQVERGTGLAIAPRVYGYLLHVDPQQSDALLLDHAERIEQPDGQTTVITLRGDIRFQDVPPVSGRAVTSADVAASIYRFRDHPFAIDKVWHATVLDAVDTPDERTLVVRTRRPYAWTLHWLGDIAGGAIYPRELVEAGADLSASGIASGPFAIEQAAKDRVRIARNPAYHDATLPYLDAMEWRIFADDGAKLDALDRREAEMAELRDRREADEAAARDPRIEVDAQPSLAWLSVGLRVDAPALRDGRVREALDLALDRDAFIRDVAFGEGQVLGPVNPHLAGGFWSLPESDVRRASSPGASADDRLGGARRLLAAVGVADLTFALQTPARPQMIDIATVVRDQLRRIGVDVRIDELDPLAWFANFRRGAFEATLIAHAPYDSPDIPVRYYHSGGVDGSANQFGFSDAELDGLIERSWGESDRDARRRTLLDAQRGMQRSRAMLQLFTGTQYRAAWGYVRNRRPDLLGPLAQEHAGLWLDEGAPGG
ncbi:MAG TPA: ABC transporter substrate-binding protein [Dehalococcoidia bacterium]|nr:ABC transporter substrate-binding protein [Dehalococcoidia bacterium]